MSRAFKFDKYAAYAASVQSPGEDARFLRRVYRELVNSEPTTMREDFCGAFALCCEWAKLDSRKQAIGLDIEPAALQYGLNHYKPLLNKSTQSRVETLECDVLSPNSPQADIICALNFSYFIFHSRETLLTYFRNCRHALKRKGLLVVDLFGGRQCTHPATDIKRMKGLTYFWEQKSFDPICNRAQFYIHFRSKDGRKHSRAFSYDWRMWSVPEIKDLMIEAGFRDVVVYWEGTSRDGTGNGKFVRRKRAESGEVWLAYVVGRSGRKNVIENGQ